MTKATNSKNTVAKAAAEVAKPTTAKVVLPKETKETPLYLITPVIGARPRWFEKKRLTSMAKKKDGSFEITLPIREAKDRKIDFTPLS